MLSFNLFVIKYHFFAFIFLILIKKQIGLKWVVWLFYLMRRIDFVDTYGKYRCIVMQNIDVLKSCLDNTILR